MWQGAALVCHEAGSRLQKVHNVRLALEKFRKGGTDGMSRIQPDDIVDGHREKTMALLWLVSPRRPLAAPEGWTPGSTSDRCFVD
jgi:hypothetical protein